MRRWPVTLGFWVASGLGMGLALPAAAWPWMEAATPPAAEQRLEPGRALKARWVRFDPAQLQALFDQADRQAAGTEALDGVMLELPLADGGSLRFKLQPLAVMAPGLGKPQLMRRCVELSHHDVPHFRATSNR